MRTRGTVVAVALQIDGLGYDTGGEGGFGLPRQPTSSAAPAP